MFKFRKIESIDPVCYMCQGKSTITFEVGLFRLFFCTKCAHKLAGDLQDEIFNNIVVEIVRNELRGNDNIDLDSGKKT